MTTAHTEIRQEPKVCAQTFASLASLGVLVHFGHEIIAGGAPTAETLAGVAMVVSTLAVTAAWYRLGRTARRALAGVLGALWSLAASEHVLHAVSGGTLLDVTGLLTFAGGLLLLFAAYWDHHRPMEESR
jgi:hypothetical protein